MAGPGHHEGIPAALKATGEEKIPPGKAMTAEQHMLDKGAQMLQSLKPIKQMSQHACTFALYNQDMTRQIETHHYITRVNQDFLQCAVYDSDDSSGRLIGKYQKKIFLFFKSRSELIL